MVEEWQLGQTSKGGYGDHLLSSLDALCYFQLPEQLG
jgi:hypothetical protein